MGNLMDILRNKVKAKNNSQEFSPCSYCGERPTLTFLSDKGLFELRHVCDPQLTQSRGFNGYQIQKLYTDREINPLIRKWETENRQ